MSVILSELKPPLPCARLSNFIAKPKLFDDDDDDEDDPCLFKKLSKRSILLDDEDSRFLSSLAAEVNSWNSFSSLLLLSFDDDDDDRSCFNNANLLNESDCFSFFESPDNNPPNQLLKP